LVCQHLAQGSSLGFFYSSAEPSLIAWCAECDAVLRQTGEWPAAFTPACGRCYRDILRRNRPRRRLLRYSLLALALAAVAYWLFGSFLLPEWRGERTLKGHSRSVNCLAFAPDGSRLFSGSYDQKVIAWDLNTFEPEVLLDLAPHPIDDLAVSPDGSYLAIACDFNTRVVFKGEEAGGPPNPIRALVVDLGTRARVAELHSPDYGIIGLTFVPGRAELIAAHRFGRLRAWDTRKWALKRDVDDSDRLSKSLAVSPDGSLLALEHDEQVRLFDAELRPAGPRLRRPQWKGRGLAFSPNGRTLAFPRRSEVVLADPRDGTVARHLPNPEHVTTITYSPDGRLIAAGSFKWGAFMTTSGRVRVWRTDSGKEVLSRKRSEAVTAIAFSPNGDRLAVADTGGSILLLSTRGW
jgi:WD40 repeat protein